MLLVLGWGIYVHCMSIVCLNIDRENRICQNCNMDIIEDEYHFLLACAAYRHLRIQYLSKYYYIWPSIRKFKQLMSCKSRNVLLNLSKYLIDAFLIRKC